MVGGRWPLLEYNLWLRMTFGGRRPLLEDDLWWKTKFGGRQPLVEDDLRWKITCGGRRSAVEDDLQRKTPFAGSLHAAYSSLQHFYFCFMAQYPKMQEKYYITAFFKHLHSFQRVHFCLWMIYYFLLKVIFFTFLLHFWILKHKSSVTRDWILAWKTHFPSKRAVRFCRLRENRFLFELRI